MDEKLKKYQKIQFWGSIAGNLLMAGIVLSVVLSPLLWMTSGVSLVGEYEYVIMGALPLSIILFCLPGIRMKRTVRMAKNLFFDNGDSTKEELLKNIPYPLKWLLKEKEDMDSNQMIESYAKYLKFYALLLPVAFVVYMYPILKLLNLFMN